MDRFIDFTMQFDNAITGHLKSNMDRFIGLPQLLSKTQLSDLKSNMDRFIVYVPFDTGYLKKRFKIQYG